MDKRILIAVGVGVGILVFALPAYGVGNSVISLIKKKLTLAQRRNATIIAEEFLAAGLPPVVAAAAIANAYAESKLNAAAVGDSGHSIGLFQLSDWGAGHDLSVEYRLDPRNNTKTILSREVLGKFGKNLRARAAEGARVGELAAIYCRDIERPKDIEGESQKRSDLAETMFPSLA